MTSTSHHNDAIVAAKTKPITFDDVNTSPYGFAVLSAGYAKLNWSNLYVLNSEDSGVGYYGNSGYFTGITSGDQVAYNPYFATDASVYLSKGTFTFESVQMTSAWNKKETVDIVGYDKKGNVAYETTVKLTDKGPLDVQLHWKGVSNVTFFFNEDYKPDKNLLGTGNNVVFDDMVISKIKGTAGAEVSSHKIVADGAFGMNSHHESIAPIHHVVDAAHPVHVALA
jgi:hypothetical protein